MRRAVLALVAAFISILAIPAMVHAQGSPVPIPVIQGPNGIPRAGATISICANPANATPCTNYASVYQDSALSIAINQATTPLLTDGLGNCCVIGTSPVTPYALAGVYQYTVSGAGIAAPRGPYTVPVSIVPSGNLVFTGQISVVAPSNVGGELWVCPLVACLYQTILAAYNALPSCTITPTPVNAGGGAGTSVTVPCGTIHVAPGSYPTPASTVIINSSFVRVMGSGPFTTILNCSTACYEISGASSWGGTASAYPGGFYDVDIEGGGSGITGLLYLDGTGLQLHRVRIAGFSGTGGQGLMLQNDTNAYSERENFEDVILDNNKVCLRMDAPNSGLVDLSMGHQNWIGLKFQLNNGQTALKMTGGAQLFSDVITGVLNTYPPNTNTYTGIDLSGLNANGILQGGFAIVVDNGGAGTLTACNGCTTSNFKPWGWNSINNSQFYTTNAGPIADTSTAGTFATGYCWSVNAVARACLDTDGGGGLHFVTASTAWLTLDPSGNGAIMFLGGSTSGSVGLQTQPNASGTLNFPNGPDTLVGRATTDTFTGAKSFASNTLLPSAAGGTDLGSASLPFGNIWLGTSATNNFKLAPAATAAARTVNVNDTNGVASVALPLFGSAGTAGYQTKRVSGCATGAAQFSTCDTTVTWTTAFADANYTAVCTGDVTTSGVPQIEGIDISAAKTGTAITVRTIALTAVAAQFTTIDCKAQHD